MGFRFLLLTVFFLPAILPAQDVDIESQYLRLQEAYTQRLQDLEQRHQRQQRELLNKFILALVRTEQSFRDEGNLDGLVASRDLRESLLQEPRFPKTDPDWPERLLSMAEKLKQRQDENRSASQTELDELNRVLFRTLEPYKVAFTRQGSVNRAIEVRELQSRLSKALGEAAGGSGAPRPTSRPAVSSNPNAYPFLLEPAMFQQKTGVTARTGMIELDPDVRGEVLEGETGFHFERGQILIGEDRMELLRGATNRTPLLTVEIAITPDSNWTSTSPPPCVFQWGKTRPDANLILTQEGYNLILYLKTSRPPQGGKHHRVDLGRVRAGSPLHISVAYRSNELIVYRNGSASQRIRSTIQGDFKNWQPGPLYLGRAPTTNAESPPTSWRGQVHLLYAKAGQDSAHQAEGNFERFEKAFDR